MSARRFREQRIMIILMFRTCGNLPPEYLPITPPAISWPTTCNCSPIIPSSVPHVPGQGRRRAARHLLRISPLHLAASILEFRTISRLLLILRHGPCFPIICNACSLPGNRRARSGFLAHSSSISRGSAVLSPSGLFLFVVAFQVPGRLQAGART